MSLPNSVWTFIFGYLPPQFFLATLRVLCTAAARARPHWRNLRVMSNDHDHNNLERLRQFDNKRAVEWDFPEHERPCFIPWNCVALRGPVLPFDLDSYSSWTHLSKLETLELKCVEDDSTLTALRALCSLKSLSLCASSLQQPCFHEGLNELVLVNTTIDTVLDIRSLTKLKRLALPLCKTKGIRLPDGVQDAILIDLTCDGALALPRSLKSLYVNGKVAVESIPESLRVLFLMVGCRAELLKWETLLSRHRLDEFHLQGTLERRTAVTPVRFLVEHAHALQSLILKCANGGLTLDAGYFPNLKTFNFRQIMNPPPEVRCLVLHHSGEMFHSMTPIRSVHRMVLIAYPSELHSLDEASFCVHELFADLERIYEPKTLPWFFMHDHEFHRGLRKLDLKLFLLAMLFFIVEQIVPEMPNLRVLVTHVQFGCGSSTEINALRVNLCVPEQVTEVIVNDIYIRPWRQQVRAESRFLSLFDKAKERFLPDFYQGH